MIQVQYHWKTRIRESRRPDVNMHWELNGILVRMMEFMLLMFWSYCPAVECRTEESTRNAWQEDLDEGNGAIQEAGRLIDRLTKMFYYMTKTSHNLSSNQPLKWKLQIAALHFVCNDVEPTIVICVESAPLAKAHQPPFVPLISPN